MKLFRSWFVKYLGKLSNRQWSLLRPFKIIWQWPLPGLKHIEGFEKNTCKSCKSFTVVQSCTLGTKLKGLPNILLVNQKLLVCHTFCLTKVCQLLTSVLKNLMMTSSELISVHKKSNFYYIQVWPSWPTVSTRPVIMKRQSNTVCSYGDKNQTTQAFYFYSALYISRPESLIGKLSWQRLLVRSKISPRLSI